MSAKIALRHDFCAPQLRKLSQQCPDSRQTCRLLALAAVYDGRSLGEAAKIGGLDSQTRRDRVYRFNEEGPTGLTNRFGVVYCERTVSKLLGALGFSHMSVRPQHPKQDERVIEALKKTSNRPSGRI